MSGRPKIGVALGSGGARGWCHIGVLHALAERGIKPDVVAGCSMGALVGAAYLAGDLERLEGWARALRWREVLTLLDPRISGGGLIGGGRLANVVQLPEGVMDIEQLPGRFAAIATDLNSGREIWLSEGPIHEAIRASIAIPGILTPARRENSWLVDGGMTNPVPVSTCRAMGADVVIAVNPNSSALPVHRKLATQQEEVAALQKDGNLFGRFMSIAERSIWRGSRIKPAPDAPPPEPAPSYISVLSISIDIMTDQVRRSRLAADPPHVMITPELGEMSFLEFHRASGAIEAGRAAVERVVPQLEAYFGALDERSAIAASTQSTSPST